MPDTRAPGWGEPGRLLAGRDGFFQPAHARVDLAGLDVGALGSLGVPVLQRASHLSEHLHRLLEEGMGGLLYHALGVDGEQGVYQQGGAAPDQRLKKALQWKATL